MCGHCIVDDNVASKCVCVIVSFFSLGVCCQPGALCMKVLLPTRPNFSLGSCRHRGSKLQGINYYNVVFTPGQSVFSGIGPICPTGSVELNKYLLGKLL